MSTEYNSKLIANLYEENDAEKATEIADEMAEIKDMIFIQPLYSAYKRFRSNGSFMSHYFLSDLKFFKSPETKDIFESIAASKDISKTDFSYCLDYLNDIEYIEPCFRTSDVRKHDF